MLQWHNREKPLLASLLDHDQPTFNTYLQWLHRTTGTHIRGPYKDSAIDADEVEEDIADEYDEATRLDTQLQRGPLQRYLVGNLTIHNSCHHQYK